MTNYLKVLIAFTIILLFSGCPEGIYPQIGKPLTEPVPALPRVDSFNKEGEVLIRWEADPAADEYILYRRLDIASATKELLYMGTECLFRDTGGVMDDRYLYSLAKVRGIREFGPWDEVLGVFSGTINDSREPDNNKSKASHLEFDLEGTLYYFRSESGEEVMDTDWFFLEVPPRRMGNVVITQKDLAGEDTFFYFAQEEELPFQVVNNETISIENYSYESKRLYFRIWPKASEFLANPALGGGSMEGYTLSLDSITGL